MWNPLEGKTDYKNNADILIQKLDNFRTRRVLNWTAKACEENGEIVSRATSFGNIFLNATQRNNTAPC